MIARFLVWLGVWSPCCHARIVSPEGWPRTYCQRCDRRLS